MPYFMRKEVDIPPEVWDVDTARLRQLEDSTMSDDDMYQDREESMEPQDAEESIAIDDDFAVSD